MKKFWRTGILILAIIIALPSIVQAQKPTSPERLSDYRELLEYRHEPQVYELNGVDLDEVLNPNYDYDAAWEIRRALHRDQEDIIQRLEEQYNPYLALTLEQAIEDLDYLIDVMKIASLDYNRVGGDKAFKKFRKKVVKELKEKAATGFLYAEDLERAIARRIHFIDNQHFWIGRNYNSPHENRIRYYEKYGYPTEPRWMRYKAHFMCQNLTFQKKGEDYLCYQNGKKVELDDLKEQGIDIVPTWNEKFELLYRLHYYGRTARQRPEVIRFKGGTKETPQWTFTTQVSLDTRAQGYAFDEVHDINGVAYINFTDEVFREYDYKRVDVCYEMGQKLQNYDLAIFDLRNNRGGYPSYIEAMLSAYLGKHSRTFLKDSSHEIIQSDNTKALKSWDSGFKWSVVSYADQLRITVGNPDVYEARGLFVVLVNNNAASCGDDSIDYLRHLSNIVVIGDATSGILVSSGGNAYFLPNSGMFISIPSNHHLWHPDYFEEGRGFYPDIWMMTDAVDIYALAQYMKEITPDK